MTRPRLSGFCNPGNARTPTYDPHQRCRLPGCTCTAPRCPCNPDPPPEETPMTMTTDPPEAAADPGTPEDAADRALAAADAVNTATLHYHPADWTDAVRLLATVRAAVDTLRAVDANLVRWLYLHGEHGIRLTVDGIPGTVSITRGRARERWDGAAAVNAYVDARIAETGGEYPDPARVIEWVLDVLPDVKCRVTPLREAGIDVEDYRTSEPGALQVGLPCAEGPR